MQRHIEARYRHRKSSEAINFPRAVDIPSRYCSTVSGHRSARLRSLTFVLLHWTASNVSKSTGSMDIPFGGSEGNIALQPQKRGTSWVASCNVPAVDFY